MHHAPSHIYVFGYTVELRFYKVIGTKGVRKINKLRGLIMHFCTFTSTVLGVMILNSKLVNFVVSGV